jgi:hypothetical protein
MIAATGKLFARSWSLAGRPNRPSSTDEAVANLGTRSPLDTIVLSAQLRGGYAGRRPRWRIEHVFDILRR